jgi:hypothetical protein
MNTMPSEDHESLCIVTQDNRWAVTLAYRNGSANSMLAKDMCNVDEYRETPRHLLTASFPVDRPCVTLQTEAVCILENADQVEAMAKWLVAASIAMRQAEEMLDMEDDDDESDAA